MNFVVNIVLYNQHVMFSFADSDKELRKVLGRDGDRTTMRRVKLEGDGRCSMIRGGAVVVRMGKVPITPLDWSVLAHEIFHATDIILARKGLRLTVSSCEAYAYLIGYLTFEAHSRL